MKDVIESKQEIFDSAVIGNKGKTESSELIKALRYSPRKERFDEKG